MESAFSKYHPLVNFTFFVVVIIFSMLFLNPIFLSISIIGAVLYYINLNKESSTKLHLFYILQVVLFVAIINPLFSHNGTSILFYILGKPITAESILYGTTMGGMLMCIIVWFGCYSIVVTSDKFIYLFGRIMPYFSLVLTISLRLVPKLKYQFKQILNSQKCIGVQFSSGKLRDRAKNGAKVISILISWALENSVETADSMKARGYGLKNRTHYLIYKINKWDVLILSIMGLLIAFCIVGFFAGITGVEFYPTITFKKPDAFCWIIYFAYALLVLLPVITQINTHPKLKRYMNNS